MPSGPAIVLTREPEDSAALDEALRRAGVEVRQIPCASTRYRPPGEDEICALPEPSAVHALLFSSRRGAEGWHEWKKSLPAGSWPHAFPRPGVTVAAVGKRTARALDAAGVGADLVAEPPRGAVMARMLDERLARPSTMVLVAGEVRMRAGEDLLRSRGHLIFAITVYENVEPAIGPVEPFDVAAVFVAAPSAARRLIGAIPWMKEASFVSIGPTTTEALRKLGVERVLEVGADLEAQKSALVRLARARDEVMK